MAAASDPARSRQAGHSLALRVSATGDVEYETLFALLPERDKRSTKVVLDVGAERVGDLLGAQLVAIILFTATVPRGPVLIAATVFGVLGLMFAARLPRNYTSALELSLVDRAEQMGR